MTQEHAQGNLPRILELIEQTGRFNIDELNLAKIIDYDSEEWEVQNPVEFRHLNSYVIKNYAFKVETGQTVKARLFHMHGYGDFAKRYAYFFKQFPKHGIEVFSFDMPGFGESDGESRGIMTDQRHIFDLQLEFIKLVEEKFGSEPPIIACGHSLGALASLNAAMQKPEKIAAVVALTPYIEIQEPLRSTVQRVATLARWIAYFWPRAPLTSFDDSNQRYYRVHFNGDPRVENKIRAQSVAIGADLTDAFRDAGAKVSVPTLFLLADQDDVVDNEYAQKFFAEINHENKEIHTIQELDHGIIHDGERVSEVFNKIIEFLQKVL